MTGEPITGEERVDDDDCTPHHKGVGDAQNTVAGEAVAAEDGAADDGTEQIVGKTHPTEDAHVMEQPAHTFEGIPGRDDGRDNHQHDD